MNRRGFVRSILATTAFATGLARTKLEVAIVDSWRAHDRAAVYYCGSHGLFVITDLDVAEGRPPRLIAASPDGVMWSQRPGSWMDGIDAL